MQRDQQVYIYQYANMWLVLCSATMCMERRRTSLAKDLVTQDPLSRNQLSRDQLSQDQFSRDKSNQQSER